MKHETFFHGGKKLEYKKKCSIPNVNLNNPPIGLISISMQIERNNIKEILIDTVYPKSSSGFGLS